MLSLGIAAIIVAAGIIFFKLKLPPFESLVGCLLLMPVLAAWLSLFNIPLNAAAYLITFVLVAAFITAIFRDTRSRSSLFPVLIFAVGFAFFHQLSLLWPDFIAIGERLRDYSILSSVIHAPDIFAAEEPWLAGYQMNYYLYWYRFGHMLATVFALPVWEVYHVLVSLTFAIFLATLYQLCRTVSGFNTTCSVIGALAIAIGSNLQGVIAFCGRSAPHLEDILPPAWTATLLTAGHEAAGGGGWWGPSRVIKGAITEFPAWSFILGDAHPHFLNLSLIPFLILVASKVNYSSLNLPAKVGAAIAFTFVPYMWLFGANAWEAPIWAGLCVIFLSLSVSTYYLTRARQSDIESLLWSGKKLFVICFSLFLLIPALLVSASHIDDPGYSFRLVGSDIARTTMKEFFFHWGFPIVLIALSSFYLLRHWPLRFIFFTLILLSFSYSSAFPLIALLFLMNGTRLALEILSRGQSFEKNRLIMEAIGIAALGLIIVPEVLFLDDTYGGENERMNTIFKIYSSNWALLHLFSFYMVGRLFKNSSRATQFATVPLLLAGLILLSGFSFQTALTRQISAPPVHAPSMGLNEIEKFFPGSSYAIISLREMKDSTGRSVILEAQGPPFSYTSHISTLSDNTAYLGWANHMNLLIRDYDEIRRREEITEGVYRSSDCLKTKQILREENIRKVVLGPLEVERYGTESSAFNCLDLYFSKDNYNIYSVD